MAVTLGNATDNIVNIDAAGGIAISSVINGAAAHLTKSGSGTGILTLSGANTYGGGTTVSTGELRATNTTGSGTGTGAVTVGNNLGVATLSGTGSISGLVTTATTGANVAHLAPGANTAGTNFGGIGTLALPGGLTLGDGTNLDFDLGTSADLITVTGGALTLGAGVVLNVSQATGFSAAETYTLFTYTGSITGAANLGGWTYTGVPSASSAMFNNTGSAITISFVSTTTPNYFDTNGSTAGIGFNGGTAVWDTSTTNWNPVLAGTGSPKTFDSTQQTLFGGTSTTVTVAAGGVTSDNGILFLSDGYVINGASIALGGATPTINVVNTGETATVVSVLSGSGGLTKAGAGKLILGGVNTYSGTTTISGGILSISNDVNLGDVNNSLVLGGSTLEVTNNVTLPDTRTVDGGGTLAVAAGKTLTINGPVGALTPGALVFSDSGVVNFTSPAVNAATSLTFNAPMTLNVTGASLALSGAITANHTSGNTIIFGDINTGSTTHTVSVAAGGTLEMSGALTGSGALSKASGGGTLILSGNNIAYSGTVTLGGTTTFGGTISITNPTALGTTVGTTAFNFDSGTLSNDSGSRLTIPKNISIGAQTGGVGAILAGGDMEFTGAVSIFKSGTNTRQKLVVNNTTTFSGVFGVSNGSGTTTGLTIGGTGKLILGGADPNTFTEAVSIDGNGEGTTLAIHKAGGLGTNPVTVDFGGTLLVGDLNAAGSISGTVMVKNGAFLTGLGSTGDVTLQSGGTLSPGTANQAIGTLTATNFTWDGDAAMKFELSAVADTSDKLSLGTGVLTKGAAGAYMFDFGNTGAGGHTYQLLSFGSAPGFILGDFTYANLAPGVTGSFALSGADLTFVTVPEPGSFVLLASGLLALGWRRRRQS